jgi:hypothetical protein
MNPRERAPSAAGECLSGHQEEKSHPADGTYQVSLLQYEDQFQK